LTGLEWRSASARVNEQREWNSGAPGREIVCEVEKTVRLYRNSTCLPANLPADTEMNFEKKV